MADDTRWCPSCRAEYRGHITECSDCLVALIDELPEAIDHSLAEWQLEDWNSEDLRSLFAMLNGRQIRYEWDIGRSRLSASHLDEEEVESLLALFYEPLEPLEPVDDELDFEPGPQLASVGRRIGGFLLDELFLMTMGTLLVNLLLDDAFDQEGRVRSAWFYASAGVALVYDVIAVGVWGRTIGKQVVGTRVATAATEQRPCLWRALRRAALPAGARFVPYVGPLVTLVIYGSALLDDRRRGFHDRVAGTIVLKNR